LERKNRAAQADKTKSSKAQGADVQVAELD